MRVNPVSEGVVGRHGRLIKLVHVEGNDLLSDQLGHTLANTFAKLTSSLAGEGHAEDLIDVDLAIGDEPHHTIRHGFGLATTSTSNNQGWLEWRLDDGLLFFSGR